MQYTYLIALDEIIQSKAKSSRQNQYTLQIAKKPKVRPKATSTRSNRGIQRLTEQEPTSTRQDIILLQSAEMRIIFAVLKGQGDFKCKQPKRDTGKLNPQEVEKILDRKEHKNLHQQGTRASACSHCWYRNYIHKKRELSRYDQRKYSSSLP